MSRANAPIVDPRFTSKQLEDTYTKKPTYSTWVPQRGKTGVIFIGSEWFNNPVDWTVNSRGDQPSRTALQNAVVHELGNYASFIASGGTSYTLFGVRGATDEDSGYALQACVFNEPIEMKKK